MYQLARTSAALSGQVQWNFILGSTASGLGVTNFSLSPISPYIPFDYKFDEDILNYTHLENLKKLRKQLGGNFFKSPVNPKFDTGYPIVVDSKEEMEDSHDATYEMRLYRPSYQIFNHQFAIFCPLWIDDDEFNVDNLEFILELMTYKKEKYKNENDEEKERYVDNTIIRKIIKPTDEIKRYIQDYINTTASLTKSNQDLLYLDLKKSQAWIKGVDVESGLPRVQDTSYIISNLLERERPLLEFDNMLLSQFSAHDMIATQVFNFNFIFDVNDLLVLTSKDSLDFNEFNAKIDVKYNGEVVEVKDLYTNYEYIPKYSTKTQSYTNTNCLDYLQDNACVELLNKNKMSQPNFHWCLLDNPEYQFQLYNGFSPYYMDNKSATGFYFNMPDIWSKDYGSKKNNLAWMKIYVPEDEMVDSNYPTTYQGPATDALTTFINKNITGYEYTPGGHWFGPLKLSNSLIQNIDWNKFSNDIFGEGENRVVKSISVLFVTTQSENFDTLSNYIRGYEGVLGEFFNGSVGSKIFICYVVNDEGEVDEKMETSINVYIINSNNLTSEPNTVNDLCFKNFINKDFSGQGNVRPILEFIQSILNIVEQPTFIFFHKSIEGSGVNIPDYASPKQLEIETNDGTYAQPSEITYIKNDSMFTYLIRYDGKLYPMFLNVDDNLFNYTYDIKQFVTDDEEFEYYNDMMWTKFPSNFPSVCYTPRNIKIENVSKYPRNDEDENIKEQYPWVEYSWFQRNRFYNLTPSFEINVDASELSEETILKTFLDYYRNKLSGSRNGILSDVKVEKHIFPLYTASYSFDYNWNKLDELDENKKYKYTIKYTLK